VGFLVIILLILCAYQAYRLRAAGRMLSNLAEAAEESRPILMERMSGVERSFSIPRLIQAFNNLVSENRKITETGQGYLDQIEATLGNLREAVVIIDSDNSVRLANNAFREIIPDNIPPLGRRLETLIQGPAFATFLRDFGERPVGVRQEMEVLIDGRKVWLEVSAARLPDNPRNPGHLTLLVLHDITRQKNLEKMRTEFVANVSHELKTPVTIIKGFADTLMEEGPGIAAEDSQRFLQKIKANSERLHNLLQDLLLLSRLESTDSVLHRERLSLRRVIEETAENFRPQLPSPEHTLTLDLADGDDIVFIDPLRISQVLNNLLENILRHAKDFRSIRIGTELTREGVHCSVADDGVGILEKDLPHIFQRFYRGEKGRSRESGGTGLGLSIVKHIIQQHEGEIEALAGKEGGAVIRFFLPYPQKMVEQAVFRSIRQRKDVARS